MIKYSILILLVFFGVACVKELKQSPIESTRKIVVNCLLTNADTQVLALSYNKGISDYGHLFEEVTDANISLFENGNKVGVFKKQGYKNWILPFRPTEGATYRINIFVPGWSEIQASTTMPYRLSIKKKGQQDYGYTKFLTKEKGEALFWMFCLSSDRMPGPFDSAPTEQDILLDWVGTDYPLTDRFNQNGSMSSLNSYGNTPSYNFYVRALVDSLSPDIDFKVQSNHGARSYVVFRNASASYDEYMKTTLSKMLMVKDDDDPIRFFDENVVYSNITNGLGIFGAYYQQWIQFN